MIRAGLFALTLTLAGPAGAEDLCPAAWDKVRAVVPVGASLSGTAAQEGDWCVVEGPVLDLEGQYLPDWHLDRLRFRGSALGWLVGGTGLPEGLEIAVEGLRLVPQMGDPQMDWLFLAQSRPNAIRAEAALAWDAGEKILRLEGMTVDFPGENLMELSATLTGVDLSSTGAMQMSVGAFALTEAELRVTTHGLFEWYVLMPFGPTVLPPEGDMEAAAEALRSEMRSAVAALPGDSVPDDSKAALVALIGELPNPSGELTLSLRSEAGIGPTRLAPLAGLGGPGTTDAGAGLLDGAVVEVGWTHDDAP